MSRNDDAWSWRTRWTIHRNAVLGSPVFLRWAMRLPFMRSVARRRAAAQFDIVAGFVYSQVLLALVQSGAIERLRGRVIGFDALADELRLAPDAADRLLRAGAALRLLESPQPGLWTLGEAGAPLAANAGALAMIRHHPLLYRDLADPLRLLARDRRSDTELSRFWTYAAKSGSSNGGRAAEYSALMAATQAMVAAQAIDAYDFSRHRRMLDIGGGAGAFVQAVHAQAPSLHCGIFDLPDVVDAVAPSLPAWVSVHRGSFKTDALPDGYDLTTVIRILHDHDDDVVAALLARIREALPGGGRLLIVEPMAGTPSAERMGDAYFGLYLWAMGSGRPRSVAEYRTMLRGAGFRWVKHLKTDLPLVASAMIAER